jgi:hypothetical protein
MRIDRIGGGLHDTRTGRSGVLREKSLLQAWGGVVRYPRWGGRVKHGKKARFGATGWAGEKEHNYADID